MTEQARPQELPAGLLTDPEMIEACRVRDFARVFRMVKVRAGVYPSMIARRCELTPSRVGEVIAGRRQLLHMDVVERIADGLRIPGTCWGSRDVPGKRRVRLRSANLRCLKSQVRRCLGHRCCPAPTWTAFWR